MTDIRILAAEERDHHWECDSPRFRVSLHDSARSAHEEDVLRRMLGRRTDSVVVPDSDRMPLGTS